MPPVISSGWPCSACSRSSPSRPPTAVRSAPRSWPAAGGGRGEPPAFPRGAGACPGWGGRGRVLVSRIARLAGGGGAFYGDKRFLTAVTDADERAAARVVRKAGFDEFGLVTLAPDHPTRADHVSGFRVTGRDRVRLFSD